MAGDWNPIGEDAICLNCGLTLAHLQRMTGVRFCGEACRARHATLADHQVCASCGRRLNPHQFGERLCGDPACRNRLEEQNKERERIRLEAIREEAKRLRDRDAESLGVTRADRYALVIVPASLRRIVPLGEDRVTAFREHLSRLIAEAAAGTGQAPEPTDSKRADRPTAQRPPSLAAVLGHACSLCRGECCRNGKNHAYLTPEVFRRYMVEHPEQTPEDVLASYLGHLREESTEKSCIYHQSDGCGLPRELRSDTCNHFLCPTLFEFRAQLSARDTALGFVAAARGTQIVAAAFCDEDGARRVAPISDTPSGPNPEGAARQSDSHEDTGPPGVYWW